MSLREKLREGLYDKEHKPRLNYARNYFLGYNLDHTLNFEELTDFFTEWRDYDEFLILQKQTESLRVLGEVKKETYAIKCSKRGNEVYWSRIHKRLRFLYHLNEQSLFDPHRNIRFSQVLYVTLTYDIKHCHVRKAWEQIGNEVNNWIRNLRKKFGKISYLRCWEASQKGYPHVHLLMIFHDYRFRIVFSQFRKHREIYRIEEKADFEKSWHSFVDVQAIRKMREGIRYVTKYLSKTQYPLETQTLTLSMCWLFKKRSFAVSGDFQDLITSLLNRKWKKLVQVDLSGSLLNNVHWVFIGIKSFDELESEYSNLDFNDIWSIELPYCAWEPDLKLHGGEQSDF